MVVGANDEEIDKRPGAGVSARARRAAPSLLLAAAALALALATLALGLRLAGGTDRETDLGRFSFSARAALPGGIDAYIPVADWGLRAPAFDAPFRLDVELRALDRQGALALAGGDAATREQVREQLSDDAIDAIARSFGWAVAATLAVCGLLWVAAPRRSWLRKLSLATAAAGVLVAAAALGAARLTFDDKAFATPSFYGRGEELAQLLSFFQREQPGRRYESSFEGALTSVSAYLSDLNGDAPGAGPTMLLASDLHNNPLVLPALARFAGGQPVLLAGDFGHDGNEAEAGLLGPRLAELGTQTLAVSGNHDSRALMQTLADNGVTVLQAGGRLRPDGGVTRSPLIRLEGGLLVAGYPDPLEWKGDDPESPRRIFSLQDLEDSDQRQAEAEQALVSWFRDLPVSPDIVMVHQNGLAQHLAKSLAPTRDRPLTILTGHDHRQHVDAYGEVVVVDAGTLGAGGVFGVGRESVGVARLRFAKAEPRLASVDLISVEPISGQAEAQRVVLPIVCPRDERDVDEGCHYEP